MSDNRKYVSSLDHILNISVAIGATSLTLSSFNDIDGNSLALVNFGTKGWGRLDPEGDGLAEDITFSGITTNANGTVTITGIKTVTAVSPYTETSGLSRHHSSGATLRISNPAGYYGEFLNKENDESISGVYTFSSTAIPVYDVHPTFSTDLELVDKKFVQDLAFAGAADANPTTKGLVEIATQTEVDAGDDTGSTTATTVVIPSTFLDAQDRIVTTDYTYGATIAIGDALYYDTGTSKLELADATTENTSTNFVGFALDAGVDTDTGKRVQIDGIVTGFSGLTLGADVYLTNTPGAISNTPGSYLRPVGRARDATTLQVLQSFPVEFVQGRNSDGTTANFNESMTFFANTDITGAEAETLSAGATSNADDLHVHSDMSADSQYAGAGRADLVKTYHNFSIPYTGGYTILGYAGFDSNAWFKGGLTGGAGDHTAITTYPIMASTVSIGDGLRFNDPNETIIEFSLALISTGTNQVGFGLAETVASFVDYDHANEDAVCFTVDASGNLYAHTSGGTGGADHTEIAIAGITLTENNTYRIHNTPFVDAKFYVNGVLEATVTTTLPTVIFSGYIHWGFACESPGGDRPVGISAPWVSVEK